MQSIVRRESVEFLGGMLWLKHSLTNPLPSLCALLSDGTYPTELTPLLRIESSSAPLTEAFEVHLNAFKVDRVKASLGDHLQDIVSSIPEKKMEKIEDFKQALNDYFI